MSEWYERGYFPQGAGLEIKLAYWAHYYAVHRFFADVQAFVGPPFVSLVGKVAYHERLAPGIRDTMITPIVDPRLVGGGGLPLTPRVASGCVFEAKANAVGVGVGVRFASAQSSGGVAEGPPVLQAELSKVRSASVRIDL